VILHILKLLKCVLMYVHTCPCELHEHTFTLMFYSVHVCVNINIHVYLLKGYIFVYKSPGTYFILNDFVAK